MVEGPRRYAGGASKTPSVASRQLPQRGSDYYSQRPAYPSTGNGGDAPSGKATSATFRVIDTRA
jgi:hypothetical protein